jgi:uncharacterized membrane protein YcaP (DUF421 family)
MAAALGADLVFEAALRAGGCLHLREVERATLETDGSITVVLRRRDSENDGDPPV